MTSNQPSDRLDRIERVLDNLSANLAEERERRLELRQDLDGEAERWAETIRIVESNTRLTESNARAIAEQREAWAETRQFVEDHGMSIAEIRQLTESNARAIAANSDTAARQGEEMRASVTDLVSMITTQAEQAEIDRAEFRATVQQILEVLTQRFTSNGH
jgi:DNA-binding transcriptional MerR regulator